MGMKKLGVILFACAALCGCASNKSGCITGLEWDSRSPEQLAAAQGQPEARAPLTAWGSIMNALGLLRVRIRILTVEWETSK